ncbi:RdRP-domain-containing protein [Meredithblackwellia eburnea MCA 4105]
MRPVTPPPRPHLHKPAPISPEHRLAAKGENELPVAQFNLFHIAIGSSFNDSHEIMIGWQDDLRYLPPKCSELVLLPEHVFIRIFASNYSTDSLSPLDIEFHYRDITNHGLVLSNRAVLGPGGVRAIDLTFHLHRPPSFWVTVNGRGTDRDFLIDGGFEGDGVSRGESRGSDPVLSLGEPSAIKMGRWYSYRLSLPASELPTLKKALVELELLRGISPLSHSRSSNYNASYVALLHRQFPTSTSFQIRYAIDGLLGFGIIIDAQVPELLDCLKEFSEKPDFTIRLLHAFFRKTRIWDIPSAIRDLISKVVITPTRVLLYPPEVCTSNHVLRRFPRQTLEGRFLRVQFWDESNRINMNYESKNDDKDQNEGIMARFRRCLDNGVELADPKSGFTRAAVRDALGDFTKETIIAKNAARRGQLYSTTREVCNVDKIGTVPDFKTEDESYTYSDGVGICTQELVTRAAEVLGLEHPIAARTSACQIRLGGMKGMLAAWPPPPRHKNGELLFPDVDWPQVGPQFEPHYDILARPSQIKFKSPLSSLGVIRVSAFSHAYLNREVLVLLYARGIRQADVMDRFEVQVAEILGAEERIEGGEGIKPHLMRLFARSQVPVPELVAAGFHREPFLIALTRLFAGRALWDLKWRARVYIEDGVNVLGVVDELGVLEENEIYCRTVDRDGRDFTVTGKCIVFRAPTRHPGDVQIVEAVDHPALRASGLTNVLIFNRRGDRDLPNMLGGGDLDGDVSLIDYTLIWDEDLTQIRPFEPMDYTPDPPNRVEAVTPADIRAFHNQYMKEDTLGAIANSHMALADQRGPEHPDCLDLCELHSIAVDFAKSGLAAKLPDDLRPDRWPDFMGPRRYAHVYQSNKPLGQMFRHPDLNPIPLLPIQPVKEVFTDSRLAAYPIPEHLRAPLMREAKRLKAAYDLELNSLMIQFQACEEEVVAGVILELPGGLKRLDKDNKLKDPLTMAYDALRTDFVNKVQEWASKSKSKPSQRLELMAVAAYLVTHEESAAQSDPRKRMLSFPFIFHNTLLSIYAHWALPSGSADDGPRDSKV